MSPASVEFPGFRGHPNLELCRCLELLGTDASQMLMPTRPIVEVFDKVTAARSVTRNDHHTSIATVGMPRKGESPRAVHRWAATGIWFGKLASAEVLLLRTSKVYGWKRLGEILVRKTLHVRVVLPNHKLLQQPRILLL